MHEHERDNPRYPAKCRACIENVMEGDVLLKNLSITGCCLECTSDFDNLRPSEEYSLDIEPEHASHISKFNLHVKCMWIRKKAHICEIGFQVTASPKGKDFQSYVDFLTYHSE